MPLKLWKKIRRRLRRNLKLRFRHMKRLRQQLKQKQLELNRLLHKLRLRQMRQHRLSLIKPRLTKLRSGLMQFNKLKLGNRLP